MLLTSPERGFIPEIEQNLLGAVLAGGDHRSALSRLEPMHFIEPTHRAVFEAIKAAHAAYGTTTMPTVVKMIPQAVSDSFQQATGTKLPVYLAGMVSSTIYEPATSRVGARAVMTQWARLNVGQETSLAAQATNDPGADPAAISRALASALDEIGSHLRCGTRSQSRFTIAEAADSAMQAAREARRRKGLVGITTGLVDLDRATGGFHRRDLIVVAARPAMGKTTLGTCFSRAAACSGVGVGMFSLEMDAAKLGARYASDIAHHRGHSVPYRDIINGTVDDASQAIIEEALEEYRSLPFWVDDASGLTMAELRAKTEAMIEDAETAGTPLGLLVVDHLTKIRPSPRYAGNRANEVGEVTDGLKELAREHDLAVVLLSQLNRGVEGREDKRPVLMDLRDSGNIEQDADAVMFLYREAYYLEQRRPDSLDKVMDWQADLSAVRHKGELSIAKQRNGPTTTIDLYMDVACSAVRNAARPVYGVVAA